MKTTRRNFVTGLMAGPVVPLAATAEQGIKAPPFVAHDYARNEAPRSLEFHSSRLGLLSYAHHKLVDYARNPGARPVNVSLMPLSGYAGRDSQIVPYAYALQFLGYAPDAHLDEADVRRCGRHVLAVQVKLASGELVWWSSHDVLRGITPEGPEALGRLVTRAVEELQRCEFYAIRIPEALIYNGFWSQYVEKVGASQPCLFAKAHLLSSPGDIRVHSDPLSPLSYVEVTLSTREIKDYGSDLLRCAIKMPEGAPMPQPLPFAHLDSIFAKQLSGCHTGCTQLGMMRGDIARHGVLIKELHQV